MRVACVGGGPAGIYVAISIKLRRPGIEVALFERNAAGKTFGWGLIFSDQKVERLIANDPVSGEAIAAAFAHWDDIEVSVAGKTTRSSGHGFIGIGRKALLGILVQRAKDLGVRLHYDHECDPDLTAWKDYDLVIAADGVNSRFRDRYQAELGVDVEPRANEFIWLGTPRAFEAFTFAFEQTEAGHIWAHAHRGAPDRSTFIVECSEATWHGRGFDAIDQTEVIAVCERIFAAQPDRRLGRTNLGRGPASV